MSTNPVAAPPAAPPSGTAAGSRVPVPPQVIENILAANPLFHGADRAFVAKLAPHIHAFEFRRGARLVDAGTPVEGLGVLVSGMVQLELADPEGEPRVIEQLEPPSHFGEAGLLGQAVNPYGVVALGDCRVLWLRTELAQSLVSSIATFGDAVGRRLAKQVSALCALPPREREVLVPSPLEEVPAKLEDTRADDVGVFDPAPLEALLGQKQGLRRARVPFVELAEYDLHPSVLAMVPPKLVRQHRLLPVRLHEKKLTVAMVSPANQAALVELRRLLEAVELEVVAISADDFTSALVRLRLDDAARPVRPGARGPAAPSINPDTLVFETAEVERDPNGARAIGDEVIKLVNRIIVAGLERDASDVHVEPVPTGVRVRFRVNGMLQDWSEQVPVALAKGITARVKVLAGLDITERRLPQDGRIGFAIGKREVDLRVSTLPANRGEKIVFRILEAAGSTRSLNQIFVEPSTLAAVRKALNRPFGGILIAGATGSGKTSSMYALLNERRTTRPDTNVIMVEDPIEYRLPGVTQVQVNPAAGLGFAQVLRAMLRQDPDVIVVGEMRDHETAQIALEAAMTGHLLLSSLHANTAVSALQRLENLGCSRALIAQSVAMVLVQRLARKLCQACVTSEEPPKALLDTLVAQRVVEHGTNVGVPRAVGCDACNGTGYVGRTVVIEALAVTDEIRHALTAGRSLTDVERIALASKVLMPFHAYSAYLMGRKLITGSEALLTVAE